jgi:predicted metal-dependent peptidase
MAVKLTPKQRLERSHIQLMRSQQFALLSGIIMLGESKVVEGLPTAATNGRDKYYGAEFIDTLSEKELNFVVAHENFHVLYKHLTTWKHLDKIDSRLTNMACDYVINQQIIDLDPQENIVAVPNIGCLIDPQFRGWDTGQVFDHLRRNQKQNQSQPSSGSCKSGGSGDESDGSSGNQQGSFDDHQWGEVETMTQEEKKALSEAVDQAIRQGDILAGKLAGNRAREIGAIPEPKVDWREQLRDFVSSSTQGRDSTTWRRPNRRWLAQGMYMPSPYSESVGPVVIGVDTSGSISPSQINEFLAEIKSIADDMPPERMHLLYWDTQVAREETYVAGEYASLVQSTKPAGGGGTDPRCVQGFVEKMHTKPDFVLMLSDGYVSAWPEFGVPTMWAMTTKETAPNAVNIRLN